MTMVAVPVTDTAQMRRLVEFASDVAELADQRADLDLRDLIDGLVGCVVIRPDGSRKLAHIEPDPLAQQKLD
jgi:hypothetical protein